MNRAFQIIRTQDTVSLEEVIDDIDTISCDNVSLLQEAIPRKPQHSLMLIEAGVPLDHQDNNGQTALQYAISRGYNDIAEVIIKKGADLSLVDNYGNAALWTAIMHPKSNFELITLLVNSGSDPELKNNAGRSPFDMANIKRNGRVLELFSKR